MCGEIESPASDIILCGWIRNIRDHGGIRFITLSDKSGSMQCIFEDCNDDLSIESVIRVFGKSILRDKKNINNKIKTGHIEFIVDKYEIMSTCTKNVDDILNSNDEVTKSKYRYLHLRCNSKLNENIHCRSYIIRKIRNFIEENGFIDIQTPIITGVSPEGARCFKVLSDRHKGMYYTLAQSPQMYKQFLMVSGFDRYYQIAPCFRDEDSRRDRSPLEFYQLDLEASFVEQQDILDIIEGMIKEIFNVEDKLPVIQYSESIRIYGTDKPDLRIPLHIEDFNNIEFSIFNDKNKSLRGVRINKVFTKNEIDEIHAMMKDKGYPGIGYLYMKDNKLCGSLKNSLITETNFINEGETILFVYDYFEKSSIVCGSLISYLSRYFEIKDKYKFCWVVNFPMYKKEDGKYKFMHNPFSKPHNVHDHPDNMLAYQYDLVCNGLEVGSGAIRNHDPDTMVKLFSVVGYNEDKVKNNFASLYDAFTCGAPQHGGIALGIERLVMLYSGCEYARDVAPFPPLQNGVDPMMGAPTSLDSIIDMSENI